MGTYTIFDKSGELRVVLGGVGVDEIELNKSPGETAIDRKSVV